MSISFHLVNLRWTASCDQGSPEFHERLIRNYPPIIDSNGHFHWRAPFNTGTPAGFQEQLIHDSFQHHTEEHNANRYTDIWNELKILSALTDAHTFQKIETSTPSVVLSEPLDDDQQDSSNPSVIAEPTAPEIVPTAESPLDDCHQPVSTMNSPSSELIVREQERTATSSSSSSQNDSVFKIIVEFVDRNNPYILHVPGSSSSTSTATAARSSSSSLPKDLTAKLFEDFRKNITRNAGEIIGGSAGAALGFCASAAMVSSGKVWSLLARINPFRTTIPSNTFELGFFTIPTILLTAIGAGSGGLIQYVVRKIKHQRQGLLEDN